MTPPPPPTGRPGRVGSEERLARRGRTQGHDSSCPSAADVVGAAQGHSQHLGLPMQVPPWGKALFTASCLCLCPRLPAEEGVGGPQAPGPAWLSVALPPTMASPALLPSLRCHPIPSPPFARTQQKTPFSDLREPFPPGSDPGFLPPQGPSYGVVQSGIVEPRPARYASMKRLMWSDVWEPP